MLCDACSRSMASASNRGVPPLQCCWPHGTTLAFTPPVPDKYAMSPCRRCGLKLDRIEMTPVPLRGMISHRARGRTLGACNMMFNEFQSKVSVFPLTSNYTSAVTHS